MEDKKKTRFQLVEELAALRKHLGELEKEGRRRTPGSKQTGMPGRFPDLEKKLERLKPNDHLCLIYESPEEWRAVVIPFLAIGLKRGEKCIYILGIRTASQIRSYLSKAGIDVAGAEASGQLVILHKTDAYTQEGLFDPERMISLLIAESEKAIAEGYPGLRETEEISVRPRGYLGLEKLLEYEAKLNRDFFPRYPCVAICQYDRWKSDPGIVKNAIMTHPLIVRNNQIYQNFYYVSPEEFLMQKREEREVQDWLSSVEQEGEAQKRVRFLSDVLERSSQPFTVSYPDGHVMFCNPAFSALTGYTEEELHTMTWTMHLTPPEWRESETKVLDRLRRTGKAQRYEKECIRKDGSRIAIEAFIHQISDTHGNIQYLYTFITDITERKRAKEMLWQSEKRFKSLFQDSPVSLWEEDFSEVKAYIDALRDSGVNDFAAHFENHPEVVAKCATMVKIVDVNKASLKLFGASDKKELLTGLEGIFVGKSYDAFRSELNAIIEGKHSCETEVVAQTLAGDEKLLAMEWSVAPGHEKTLSRVLASIIDITERRRAEKLLKKSEASLRAIFDSTVQIFVLADRDGTIRAFNKATNEWAKVVAAREVEVGDSLSDFVLEQDISRFKEDFNKALNGELVRIQWKMHGIWFEFSYNPVWEGNEVTGVCLSCLNIDERKKAVMALAKSEERFRSLIKHSSDIITILGADGSINYQSASVERILGYKPEDLVGKNLVEFVHPEDVSIFQSVLAKLKKQPGILVAPEFRVRHADGSWIHLEAIGNNLIDDSVINGIVLNCRDITERKGVEEALRESMEMLRSVFASSPNAITVTDLSGKIIDCNQATLDMHGFSSKDEIIGRSAFSFIAEKDHQRATENTKKTLERGATRNVEYTLLTMDGREFPGELSASVVRDSSGDPVAFMAITSEITERKRIEKALIRKERIARERARLLTDLRNLNVIDDILTRVCEAVRDSGVFERAVMTLHEPGKRIVHLGQVGLAPDVVERARKTSPMDDELTARVTDKRFLISNSFFIPVETGVDFSQTGRYIPEKKVKPVGGDWQPGDELFVPLYDASGDIMGYLSADTPTDGCRPDVMTIRSLEILVEAGASRVRDVEAEEVLRRERNFSQSIIKTANNVIICLDADAKIMVFNEECERVTGYRSEEVMGKPWPELFLPPDHLHHKLKSFAKWVRNHPSDRYEGPIVTKSGEIRTILWSNSAMIGPNEKDITAIAIGQDITERKKAVDALKESEEKFRELTNFLPQTVYEMDLKGNLTFANKHGLDAFGYTQEDIDKGLSALQLFVLEDRDRVRENMRRIANGEESGGNEYTALRKDGSTFSVVIYSASITRGKKAVGFRGVVIDMTDRKQAEEKLLKLNECFLLMGPDSMKNIGTIVRTAGEILGGICALYNRMERKRGILSTWAIWPEPKGYKRDDNPEGHICYDVIKEGKVAPTIVENLEGSKYEKTDPNVKKYKLKSYIGCPVRLKGEVVGSFCVCDVKKRKFTEEEVNIVSMLAKAVAIEEDRRRTEHVLRESETRTRLYLESAEDVIVVQDLEGKYLYYNGPSAYGVKSDEVVGKTPFDVHAPAVAEKIMKGVRRVAESKRGLTLDRQVVWKGKTLWFIDQLSPVKDADGNVKSVVTISRNITERKQMEDENARMREYLGKMFDSVNDSIFVTDMERNFVTCNEATERIFGYKKEEIIGKSAEMFYPDRRSFKKMIQTTLKQIKEQGCSEGEITLRRKDGNSFSAYATASLLVGNGGEPIGIVGVVRDITDSKRMEEDLKNSGEYFRSLVETASDAIVSIDERGKIVFWNNSAEVLFGYSLDEVVGKPLTSVMPERFRKAHETGMKRVISRRKPSAIGKTVQIVGLRKDGSEFSAEMILSRWKTKEGTLLTGIIRSVSECK